MPIDISIASRQSSTRRKEHVSEEAMRATMEALTKAVLAVPPERCPFNTGQPSYGPISRLGLAQMARAGVLRIEVFTHNFRRVTFLAGPLKGKATAGPPPVNGKPEKPYKTIP